MHITFSTYLSCIHRIATSNFSCILWHIKNYQDKLGSFYKAERVGFEPTRPLGQTVFKTASLWPLRYLSKNVLNHYIMDIHFCQGLFHFLFWKFSQSPVRLDSLIFVSAFSAATEYILSLLKYKVNCFFDFIYIFSTIEKKRTKDPKVPHPLDSITSSD